MSIAAAATSAGGVAASYLPFIFSLNHKNFPQSSQFGNTIPTLGVNSGRQQMTNGVVSNNNSSSNN